MPFFVYMLRCGDDSFYVGSTDALEARLAQHGAGTGSQYTRDHQPIQLVWFAEFPTRDEAINREQQIKGWSQAKKQALVERDWERLKVMAIGRERFGLALSGNERKG